MKAIGIIAEYNPFHNGHLYHIEKIKEKYPDYTIIAVISGNYTERGEVSFIDKWKKTEVALKNGIDLVIELPVPFTTQSADFFAYGSITILENLGVEKVVFGSENNNIEELELIAKTQLENEEFDSLVHIYSKMGYNYPTALSLALKDLTNTVIDTPNDLLGVSYIKSIIQNNYKIIPETIKRTNDYSSNKLTGRISSATSIRQAYLDNKEIKEYIPNYSIDEVHTMDNYFNLLKYKIISEKDLSIYQTVSEGIENLIKKEIINSNNYEELVNNLKSKRYTENKIKRMLLHILVGFTKEQAKHLNKITYLRLLGFNDKGRSYLNKIKKDLSLPIISKINRDKDEMLEFEIETTKIYFLGNNNYQEKIKKEFENVLYIKGE